MPAYPRKLPGFRFRKPDDAGDEKLLADVKEHGWHVVGVPDDEEGPGFCYTVGVYLRTLQPEILMMGAPMEITHHILNGVAEHLLAGGLITPGTRCQGFLEGLEVLFRPIHPSQFHEHLGCANWFYNSSRVAFPAWQCFWPDPQGRFPHEDAFDPRCSGRQIDLSLPRP